MTRKVGTKSMNAGGATRRVLAGNGVLIAAALVATEGASAGTLPLETESERLAAVARPLGGAADGSVQPDAAMLESLFASGVVEAIGLSAEQIAALALADPEGAIRLLAAAFQESGGELLTRVALRGDGAVAASGEGSGDEAGGAGEGPDGGRAGLDGSGLVMSGALGAAAGVAAAFGAGGGRGYGGTACSRPSAFPALEPRAAGGGWAPGGHRG